MRHHQGTWLEHVGDRFTDENGTVFVVTDFERNGSKNFYALLEPAVPPTPGVPAEVRVRLRDQDESRTA